MKRKKHQKGKKKYKEEKKGFRLKNSRMVQKGGKWGRKRGVVVYQEWS